MHEYLLIYEDDNGNRQYKYDMADNLVEVVLRHEELDLIRVELAFKTMLNRDF
jgi:YD repeat-containing protein